MIVTTAELATLATKGDVPQRIVSLVPSLTELVCDLGFEQQLVGCTKFCVHPHDLRKKISVVGGTKQVDVEKVAALNPGVVIASKEENIKDQVERIGLNTLVWLSDIVDVESADFAIKQLGLFLGKPEQAAAICEANRGAIQTLRVENRGAAIYLIWREPYMSVGGDTYIHAMLEALGYTNLCADQLRYPSLSVAQLKTLVEATRSQGIEPHILLSSEPYPFKEKHVKALEEIFPAASVSLVDGELYSWYGSRLGTLGK